MLLLIRPGLALSSAAMTGSSVLYTVGAIIALAALVLLFQYRAKKKPLKIPLIALAAAILILVVGFAIYPRQAVKDYQEAARLMKAGEYAQAEALFVSLDGFKDAVKQAALCEQAFAYSQAVQLKDQGQYAAAEAAFIKLGDYEDAADLAAWCNKKVDYDQAVKLMDDGSFAAAQAIFSQLGDFEQAKELAQTCQDTLDYSQAVAKMKAGDYQAAITAFGILGSFKDSAKLLEECNNLIIYEKAEAALKASQYYNAYELYKSIPGFKDSTKKAASCIQTLPDTRVLTKNADYSFNFAPLRFNTAKGVATYIKILDSKNKVVATAFVNSGKTLDMIMPKGSFTIKYATGTTWFGSKDLFGKTGSYQQFDQVFKFTTQDNGFEITFKAANGNLGSQTVNQTDF
jgi:tetratricopeptide (TPR) repeat protein